MMPRIYQKKGRIGEDTAYVIAKRGRRGRGREREKKDFFIVS